MKNIYPSFYDYLVTPSPSGFIAFYCDACDKYFLPKITGFKSENTCCPYCGKKNNINHFYQLAYQEKIETYYLISVKNLLSLIDIEFSDFNQFSEENLQNYLTKGYEKLNELINEDKISIESKVYLNLGDIVNLEDFHVVKMRCCDNVLQVNKNYPVNYCIYCK